MNRTNQTPATERAAQGRFHRADLASGLGAVGLGVGLGALLAPILQRAAVPILLAGAAVHLWGMFDKRRLEKGAARLWWAESLYWLCWVLLVGGLGVGQCAHNSWLRDRSAGGGWPF